MKKLIGLIVLSLGVFSCQKTKPVEYVLFSGNVKGNAKEVIVQGNDLEQIIPIAENGSFKDTLHIVNEGYYNFYIGNERSSFYLAKGSDLNLNIDLQQFDESIVYTGIGAEENNYLAKKYLKLEELTTDRQKLFGLNPDEFKVKSNEMKSSILELLNSGKLSSDFVASETKIANYEHLGRLYEYEGNHKYITKNFDMVLPENFLEEGKDFNFLDEKEYTSFEEYKNIATTYIFQKFGKLQGKYQGDQLQAVKGTLDELDLKGKIKEDFLMNMSYSMLSSPDMDGLYEILKTTPNERHQTYFEKQYNKLKNLVKGKPSPAFEYENYKGGSTALADLKGKYVYIDVWATWCAPCKEEIPHLKKVEEEYHDKNIEFVSISVDQKNAYEAWKNMVTDKELGGIQLFADKSWQSDFVTSYAISGIPRFILIDPEGNIVNADAPRPSSPRLMTLLNELNI